MVRGVLYADEVGWKSGGCWNQETYVRHRDYSPTLGRFIERDPIGFEAGDGNWYRFVANGPTRSVDPTGLTVGDTLDWLLKGVKYWDWYKTGHGKMHDLSEEPVLYNTWLMNPLTQKALASFKADFRSFADDQLTNVLRNNTDCQHTTYRHFDSTYKTDYAPTNIELWRPLYFIGGTTLIGRGFCVFTTTCDDAFLRREHTECNKTATYYDRRRCVTGKCQGFLRLDDWFIDAADPPDRTSGNQEFAGGVGYHFTARIRWSFDVGPRCTKEVYYDPFH